MLFFLGGWGTKIRVQLVLEKNLCFQSEVVFLIHTHAVTRARRTAHTTGPDAPWCTAIYSYSDLSRPLRLVVSFFVKKVIYVLVVNPGWLLYLHCVRVFGCVRRLGVKRRDSCKRPQNNPPFIHFPASILPVQHENVLEVFQKYLLINI